MGRQASNLSAAQPGVLVARMPAAFSSSGLLAYAAFTALAFHLRVVYGEAPWLERKHGAAWQVYAKNVPRWLRLGAG